MKRHETKRFKTERHYCQKWQPNRTVNTVLQNDTEHFWKRFFDAFCTCTCVLFCGVNVIMAAQPRVSVGDVMCALYIRLLQHFNCKVEQYCTLPEAVLA